MKDYKTILLDEFQAEKDTFVIKLRMYFEWDKKAFSALIEAMRLCCIDMEDADFLPRWLTDVFYSTEDFVKSTTKRKDFEKVFEKDYYDKACRRLGDLSYWFFSGRCPYMDGHGFEPL